ncbi:MAG: uracil-DNA glycosylase [Phenylobacterium sp.]|jgi:uracil-DNA glycosylase
MKLSFDNTITQAQNCRLCESFLEPNPVFSIKPQAKLLIIGQAPGSKVHKTNIPWNDPSGDRLRSWLGVDREQFYDSPDIAILPCGLCYPGKGKSGDLPPPKICAQTWHTTLLALMPDVELTLLIGQYAQNLYLAKNKQRTLTLTVQAYQQYLSMGYFVLPHPSPRNGIWLRRNSWFDEEVVPALTRAVAKIL